MLAFNLFLLCFLSLADANANADADADAIENRKECNFNALIGDNWNNTLKTEFSQETITGNFIDISMSVFEYEGYTEFDANTIFTRAGIEPPKIRVQNTAVILSLGMKGKEPINHLFVFEESIVPKATFYCRTSVESRNCDRTVLCI